MLAGIGEYLIACLVTALIVLILEARYLPFVGCADASEWQTKLRDRREE